MNAGVVETERGWEVGVGGARIVRVCLDYSIQILLDGGGANSFGGVELTLEQPVKYLGTSSGESLEIVPGDPHSMGAASALFDQQVTSLTLGKDGYLRLSLASGAQLLCGAVADYESWSVTALAEGGFKVVASPGGEVFVWKGAS